MNDCGMMSDPFIVCDDRGYATGQIFIPADATVTEDKYDKETNIHFVMFNFWDETINEMQHCLYEIDYEYHKVKSFIKDNSFSWVEYSVEKLSFY